MSAANASASGSVGQGDPEGEVGLGGYPWGHSDDSVRCLLLGSNSGFGDGDVGESWR